LLSTDTDLRIKVARLWDGTRRLAKKVKCDTSASGKISCFYDKNGVIVQVSKNLEGGDLEKAVSDVVFFSIETSCSTVTTYVLRDSKYDSIMRKVHSKRVKGEDSTIRFYSADNPASVVCKLSALPESGWRRALAKCSDIGFGVVSSTVVSLLAVLLKTLVFRTPLVVGDFIIFLLLLSIGLAIGSGAQVVYRRVAAEAQ
jgi:hypothetical protein